MRKWTKTAGLLFVAAASVYSDQAFGQRSARPAKAPPQGIVTDVKVLEETNDPFATSPATQPASLQGDSSPAVLPSQLLINNDGTFSLNIVSGADLVEQLRVIGFQAQMSIIPSKDVRGALPAIDLYDVTVTDALDALLHANGYAWRQKGNFIYVYSVKEIQEMERANRVANTEVFRLYYTNAADMQTMIKPVLSENGQLAFSKPTISGLESGTKDAGGNSDAGAGDILVITDYPENLDRVRAIIKEIDRRPQQILIEATILRAALSEDNALGVDFNVVGGVDFNTLGFNNSGQLGNTTVRADDGGSIVGDDRVHSVGTGTNFTTPINGGLKVGYVTRSVSVFLAALEGVTDTAILANPKVLALNKQKGEVIVGRKDGYLTTTVTESTATQTVEFLDTGTRLIFRPFIGDDGYIRMEIHPEDSSGGVNAQGLPSKVTTEVTSNVMIKDGHTIVIGGLFRESSDSARNQVPFLGNIPLAGYLFRQQRDRSTREEVIILLTPHIIKDNSVYSQLSEEQMKNAERLRVGVRKGMMPFGRERMADMWYQCAIDELDKEKPNRKKALFYLNAATGLNPKFTEAINLKEDLSGKEITTSHGSSIRTFVSKSIMIDLAAPATQPADIDDDNDDDDDDVDNRGTAAPTTQPDLATSDTELISERSRDDAIEPLCESDVLVEFDLLSQSELITPRTPAQLNQILVLAPSTQPSKTDTRSNTAPSTQPSGFGISSLKEMLLPDGDEMQKKTTITELPMEELDDE